MTYACSGSIQKLHLALEYHIKYFGESTIISRSFLLRYDDLPLLSLLVIDPDQDVRAFLKRWLRPANYDVEGCSTGQEGLAMSRQKSYDLIILEPALPDMDGLDLYQTLQAEGTPLLVLFRQPVSQLIQRARAVGVQHSIQKPFLFLELLLLIETACGRTSDVLERTYPFLKDPYEEFLLTHQVHGTRKHISSPFPPPPPYSSLGTFPCPHCGVELRQSDTFCLTCGRRVEE